MHLWIERKEFRCPHCGSHDVSAYEVRERMARGVPNGNVPVLMHFHAHRICCRECGKMSGEQFAFLPTPKSRITRALAKTIVALRSEMGIKAIAAYYGLPWNLVKDTEKALAEFFERLRRWRKHIVCVCMDMSNSYCAWVGKNLPNADVVFDHFHVVKAMNDALDKTRRRTAAKADERTRRLLKGCRRALSGNAEDLSDAGKAKIETVRENFSELSDAYAFHRHRQTGKTCGKLLAGHGKAAPIS